MRGLFPTSAACVKCPPPQDRSPSLDLRFREKRLPGEPLLRRQAQTLKSPPNRAFYEFSRRAGFPLAYEVMNGNTSDRKTLPDFLQKIEATYGKARRVWVMDRGVPTEAILKGMREPERQTFYLVGTPKSRISEHEKKWLDLPWQKVRDSVEVKLYQHDGELYVLAKSDGRQAKEIAMRRKRLVRLLRKLRAK